MVILGGAGPSSSSKFGCCGRLDRLKREKDKERGWRKIATINLQYIDC
jgi:hypothetical protein